MCIQIKTLCLPLKSCKWRLLDIPQNKTGTRVLPWQQQSKCQSVSFVMYIFGAKLEEHCSNISGDYLSGTAPYENPNSFAVLPFINGVKKPLTRIPRRHDIQVVNKPLKHLQQEFPSPSFRSSIEHQPNVVYKIPCIPIVIGARQAKPAGVLKLVRKNVPRKSKHVLMY